jgi:hypothetical protein
VKNDNAARFSYERGLLAGEGTGMWSKGNGNENVPPWRFSRTGRETYFSKKH